MVCFTEFYLYEICMKKWELGINFSMVPNSLLSVMSLFIFTFLHDLYKEFKLQFVSDKNNSKHYFLALPETLSAKKNSKPVNVYNHHWFHILLLSDSSMEYTDSSGVDLQQFIIQTLHKNQKDRMMLLKIEHELVNLVKDTK